jgi:hypothetical protein
MFDIYVASNISKLSVHAAITKTIRPLLSLANRTNNDYDTIIEPTGLIPTSGHHDPTLASGETNRCSCY